MKSAASSRAFFAVAGFEYRRLITSKQFLFTLIGIPLLVILILGLAIIAGIASEDQTPVGVVDLSGELSEEPPSSIISYTSEARATEALRVGTIQAYFLLPKEFSQKVEATLVYRDSYSEDVVGDFTEYLQLNLVSIVDEPFATRAIEGSDPTVRLAGSGREFQGQPTLGQVLPLIIGALFTLMIAISATHFTQIISLERENRLVEMLATSVSTGRIIAGKVVGISGVVLTQFISWIGLGIVIVILARALGYGWLEGVEVDPIVMALTIGLLIPAFIMMAGLISAIGALAPTAAISQQVAAAVGATVFSLMSLVPLVAANPSGPMAVGMSLFPLSAAMAMPFRVIISDVPSWQVLVSFLIVILFAFGAVWLAGRSLRLGMLLSGQGFSIRRILR